MMESLLGPLRQAPVYMVKVMSMIPWMMALIVQIWALIGLWFIFSSILNVARFLYAHFLRGRRDLVKSFGRRVLIVGHVDEFAWALVTELSRRGHAVAVASIDDSSSSMSKVTTHNHAHSEISVVHIDATWPKCTPDQLNVHARELLKDREDRDGKKQGAPFDMAVLLPPSATASAPRGFASLATDPGGDDCFASMSAHVWIPTWLVRLAEPKAVITISSTAADLITPQNALHGALSAFTARLTANLCGSSWTGGGGTRSNCYSQRLIVLRAPDAPTGNKTGPMLSPSKFLFGVSVDNMARLCCSAIGREHILAPHAGHAVVAWACRDYKMGPWIGWLFALWDERVSSHAAAKVRDGKAD